MATEGEIKQLVKGKWKAVKETYQFQDLDGNTIHPDQIDTKMSLEILLDGINIFGQEENEPPTTASYEIVKEVLDFFIIQNSGTETYVYDLRLAGNNMIWIDDKVPHMTYFKDNEWKTAPKSIYTIEFVRI